MLTFESQKQMSVAEVAEVAVVAVVASQFWF
jgi:hypothetical protein